LSEERRREEKKKFLNWSLCLIILLILIVDQLAKSFVQKTFQPGQSKALIENVFHITLVQNRGVAFGIFSQQHFTLLWICFALTAALVVIFNLYRKGFLKSKSRQFYLALVLAGAAGNLIDRIRFGYVVDFLDFRIWPVFNLADSAITVGVVLLILHILKQKDAAHTF
jgi:signal peptidase II